MILSPTLRTARITDLDELLKFLEAFHQSSPYAGLAYDKTKVADLVVTAIKDPKNYILLVSVDEFDLPVGVLAATKVQPTFSSKYVAAELAWYIDPAYRNYKRGYEQVLAYEAWAKSVGCTFPQVSKLSSSPESVEKMYKRWGYREVETSYIKE